ncbi:MAG: hypothetical protein U1E73_13230 [Planctomycetota bacterium]
MKQPRMRPEFKRPLAVDPAVFWQHLEDRLRAAGGTCRGQIWSGGAILRLRSADERVWSPALHLHVEGAADGGFLVHGRFSPSSPVWTAFLAIYLLLAILGMSGLCWGMSQMILHEPPWAFLGVPLAAALAAFTYGAAIIGQGLGADDMYEMRSFIDHVAEGAP